jgi:mannose-6-phosphate isomerase
MSARRLTTRVIEKPWGVDALPAPFAAEPGQRIGEIWFEDEPGSTPPLLVKYIFTSERLSIQVHPDDHQGRARGLSGGKEECWLILDAHGDARLGIGTTEPLSPDQLRKAALDGSIEQLMDWKTVRKGDFFFVPAGTVHAIGAGLALVEVQQNVDVTYRLYDYGRPRELHLDDGVAVSRAQPYDRPARNLAPMTEAHLLDRREAPFALDLETFDPDTVAEIGSAAHPLWFIPLEGTGTLDGAPWQAGQCWMIEGGAELICTEPANALIASMG